MNLKTLLLAGTVLAAIGASGAKAANTAIIIWNASDPLGAEAATGTGQASILSSNLGGITVSVSSVKKGINPNDLTEANINIDNTTGVTQTLNIIAGANGYLGVANGFKLTGAIGVTAGSADLIGEFLVTPNNFLNGLTTSAFGGQVGSFDSLGLIGPQSFAFNGFGADLVGGPYGLGESLQLTLSPGASVFVQGVSMDASAVPEARTWVMASVGFGLLALLGLRKRKGAISIA